MLPTVLEELVLSFRDGAMVVQFPDDTWGVWPWRVGHTINIFSREGKPLTYFTVGDMRQNAAEPEEIAQWITERVEEMNRQEALL